MNDAQKIRKQTNRMLSVCECENAIHNSITYIFNICTKYMTTLISRILFHTKYRSGKKPTSTNNRRDKYKIFGNRINYKAIIRLRYINK